MGTGWRRAFCTSSRGDPDTTGGAASERKQSPSPGSCVRLGIFSGGSGSTGGGGGNPSKARFLQPLSSSSTPRRRTTASSSPSDSPKLQCKTGIIAEASPKATATATATATPAAKSKGGSPRLFQSRPNSSSSSSPRSPSRFALFKTALRFSRNRCGICAQSVRSAGGRTAVFTAECSHVFHFPCISSHVRSEGCLVCPVCSATWQEVPLLSSVHHPPQQILHRLRLPEQQQQQPQQQQQNTRGHRRTTKDLDVKRGAAGQVDIFKGEGPVIKVYDDDESLLPSPTSRAGGALQFNPIPEADDEYDNNDHLGEEEEPAEDDRGGGGGGGGNFTPLPLPSNLSSSSSSSSRHTTLKCGGGSDIEVSVISQSAALISTGRNPQSYVIAIRVRAPIRPPPRAAAANTAVGTVPSSLLDQSCRAPIDLVTVLDVSGSMTVAKLQMLKRAMRLVITSLGARDRLSIVAFSTSAAKRLLPLCRMSRLGQRSARQIVDRLVVCSSSQAQAKDQDCSSCVGDALRKATKVLEDRRERNPVATIMLLSDGHAQQQQQQQQHSSTTATLGSQTYPSSATRFTHLEIPIHPSGFGDTAAAAPLLTPQQQQQQQQQKHRSSNMPVGEDAFAKCVNGLVSMVLQDVHLQFVFPSGVISSIYSYGGSSGGISQAVAHGEGGRSVRLGDLYAEEERDLLVELRVRGGLHHAMSLSHSLSVKCSYRDPATQVMIHLGDQPLDMPPFPHPHQISHNHGHRQLFRSSSSASLTTPPPSEEQQQQQRLKNLFVTSRAIAESRRLVDLNDLDMAVHLLSSARSLLLQQSASVSSHNKLVLCLEAELADLQRQQQWRQRRQQQQHSLSPSQRRSEQAMPAESRGGGGEPLTPTSAWRAAEQLAKVAIMRKSLNRVSDLHGLENARF